MKRMKYIRIETFRDGYAPNQCGGTVTVGELIKHLKYFDDDMPIYFSNDDGYTYGAVDLNEIVETVFEDDEDEEEW